MNTLNDPRLIMTEEDIARTIQRMAHQIWERNAGGDLVLVGIRSRGVTLARRIQEAISRIAGREIPIGELDIGLYRDDINLAPAPPNVRSTEIPFDVEGKDVVLMDDVLFTGRTVRAALNALMDLGRPNQVQLLVLIDRGHRELPIQPDYVGKEIKTYHNEIVAVRMKEEDGKDEVVIGFNGN